MNPQPKPSPRSKAPRKPLRQGQPIKRKKRLTAKRWGVSRGPSKRVQRKTEAEKAYTAWIHTQPCVGRLHLDGHVCLNRNGVRTSEVEQSHERNMTGLGLKANDLRSVPKCGWLARQWDEHKGWFRGWSKEQRRDWMAARIEECHRAWADAQLAGVA